MLGVLLSKLCGLCSGEPLLGPARLGVVRARVPDHPCHCMRGRAGVSWLLLTGRRGLQCLCGQRQLCL